MEEERGKETGGERGKKESIRGRKGVRRRTIKVVFALLQNINHSQKDFKNKRTKLH